MRERAAFRCEYCRLPEAQKRRLFHIDHAHARQHITNNSIGNLALACDRCNGRKGPNAAGVDPVTRNVVPLFNPRTQKWEEHFAWRDARIISLTTIGAVPIHVLGMNESGAIDYRRMLMNKNLF